jgi:threonine dehydratase
VDLDPTRIAAARAVIEPVFQRSPQYVDQQLSRELGRTVVVKDETRNPVLSFKGRGACFLVANLPTASHVVCSSSGNFGHAIAYACRSLGLRCTVFLSDDANPIVSERVRGLGADARIVSDRSDRAPEAKKFAASIEGGILVEDARDPASAEGAGTIGLELREAGRLDAIIVPVGDGALISGVACAVKEQSPSTLIIGACPKAAPSVARSWRTGSPTRAEADTIADGLSTTDPIAASVTRMRALVDDMLLVSERGLIDAMRLGARTLGALLEPSGAAGLAAMLEHDPPAERVAVLLTGSMVRPEHLALLSDHISTRPGS